MHSSSNTILTIKRRWIYVIAVGSILLATSLYLLIAINQDLLRIVYVRNIPSRALVVDTLGQSLLIIGLFGSMAWIVYSDVYTVFTENGIEKPGLWRRKIIYWHDIQCIENHTTLLRFISTTHVKIDVNLFLIRNLEHTLKEIQKRIPEHIAK